MNALLLAMLAASAGGPIPLPSGKLARKNPPKPPRPNLGHRDDNPQEMPETRQQRRARERKAKETSQ